MELKYQQGSISHNALLDAADKVSAAEETVEQARLDLFSAYNTYRWAVEHGIRTDKEDLHRMKSHRVPALLLCGALLVSLSACGGEARKTARPKASPPPAPPSRWRP